MGVIMVVCPKTGKAFSTGIQTSESLKLLPHVQTASKCPHCGAEHSWWPSEATLVDGQRFGSKIKSSV
jgi:hypothetical protein